MEFDSIYNDLLLFTLSLWNGFILAAQATTWSAVCYSLVSLQYEGSKKKRVVYFLVYYSPFPWFDTIPHTECRPITWSTSQVIIIIN
jgi:hypothetical protein